MSRLPFTSLVTVVALSAMVGCSKKTPEPTKAVAPVATTAAAKVADDRAPSAQGGDGKLDPNDPSHGKRKLMGLDVGVYVDGVQSAVLRWGDLPAIASENNEGKRFRLYDYVKAIGVAPESIKSIHIHGNGDRIASIEGAELLKDKGRFLFSFLSGDTGAPISRWDTDGLKNEFVVHEFRKVTIYVKKPVPVIDKARQCHVGADGECTEEVPYASGPEVKGTRIYVDGKMVGFVKRRQLQDSLVMGDTKDGERKYNVKKLIAQLGVDTNGIKAVELVAGDDIVARASTGEQFEKLAPEFYFTLPKHNHGKVRVHVPAEIQLRQENAADRDALVSSVQVYKSTKPVDRELTAISADTDMSVQVAANTARELGRGER
ncbi:MAG: hypothetical protein JST00_07740 [Deltaproteobacteria bacterium]|nr:hypothetical protein [Deltaproteobacteria bacterium]